MIFHEDVLVDILSRLPAKSIGQFRCVSKSWNTLLSHPHFIKTHLNFLKRFPFEEQSIILVSNEPYSLFYTQLHNADPVFDELTTVAKPLNFNQHLFDSETVVGNLASCDGLILVEDDDCNLLLINPTTKKNRVLPRSAFALDPRSSFTMYGLGYDSISDDYKIVTLSYYDADNDDIPEYTEVFVNIYSVKNGSWKRALNSPYDHAIERISSGVLVNERIHWIAARNSDSSTVIVAFDLGQERFYEVPPPLSLDRKKFKPKYLSTVAGYLCMSAWNRSCRTDIWVMREYGVQGSWVRLTIPGKSEYFPLYLFEKEELVMVKDVDTNHESLVIYNMRDASIKNVVIEDIPIEFVIGGAAMESLVSPYYCDVVAGTTEE